MDFLLIGNNLGADFVNTEAIAPQGRMRPAQLGRIIVFLVRDSRVALGELNAPSAI